MSHVFLVGFMGAGKTTVGPLARRATRHAVRRPRRGDRGRGGAQPSARSSTSIGEDTFRELESRGALALSSPPNRASWRAAEASSCATRTARRSSDLAASST